MSFVDHCSFCPTRVRHSYKYVPNLKMSASDTRDISVYSKIPLKILLPFRTVLEDVCPRN